MKVLVACEFSQVVTKAFRERGHEAYSCDLLPTEGNPEWHIQADALSDEVWRQNWDLLIAHPECRYLCFSGERWIKNNPERQQKRIEAFEFLKKLYYAPVKRIAIENSHSIFLQREFRMPTQTIHPYHFGDPFKKSVCLWLRNLKPLVPDNILWQRFPAAHREPPGPNRSRNRARTYPGIARAMAEQWTQ